MHHSEKREGSTGTTRCSGGSKKIYTYFQNPDASNSAGRPNAWLSSDQLRNIERHDAIKALDKKLRKKTTLKAMNGQNLVRHQAVLSFLRMQEGKQLGETRDSMSRTVARCFGKGTYFARRLITWETEWIKTQNISEGRRGCFTKVKSWLHDEGVLLAVREWIQEQPTDQITAYNLAKAVGDYLDSKKAASTVEKILQFGPGENRIRARTARRWLNQLGLVYGRYRKEVYVDGHERRCGFLSQ